MRPVPPVEAVEWLLMECAYFRDDLCSSCPSIETAYTAQVQAKQEHARACSLTTRSCSGWTR